MIAQSTITPADPPTPDPGPPPWTRHPLAPPSLSLADMRVLAGKLHRALDLPVAILSGGSGYWLATPADRAEQWAEDLATGRARVVETVGA